MINLLLIKKEGSCKKSILLERTATRVQGRKTMPIRKVKSNHSLICDKRNDHKGTNAQGSC